jgi:hypothetical protein
LREGQGKGGVRLLLLLENKHTEEKGEDDDAAAQHLEHARGSVTEKKLASGGGETNAAGAHSRPIPAKVVPRRSKHVGMIKRQ